MDNEFIKKMRRIHLNNRMEFLGLNTKFSMSEAAEILNIKNVGRNKLYKLLKEFDIIGYYKQVHEEYIEKEYFICEIQENSRNEYVTKVTPKGIVFLQELFKNIR